MTNELYHHGVKGQKWGVRRRFRQVNQMTKQAKSRQDYQEKKAKARKKALIIGGAVVAASLVAVGGVLYHDHIRSANQKVAFNTAQLYMQSESAKRALNRPLGTLDVVKEAGYIDRDFDYAFNKVNNVSFAKARSQVKSYPNLAKSYRDFVGGGWRQL